MCGFAALRAAMPVGDRRSKPSPRFNADRRYAARRPSHWRGQRHRCGFRAPARCRSETGAPPSPRFCAVGDARTARRRRATHLGGYPHRQRDAQARERRPLVGTARRRRAAGRTPTSGVVRLSAGTPAFGIIRTDAFRCASRSGADRRSAFQAVPAILPGWRSVGVRSRADRRSAFQAVPAILPGWRSVGSQPCDWRGAASLGRVSRSRGCRSETGAPRWWCGFRAARCRSETGAPWGSVGGAGFALTRDAGRRPALRALGAGFALTRDAGRRPALHGAALVVRVSRSRAMPVGDRRSMGRRWWCGFRAARAMPVGDRRSSVVGAGFALTRDGGRRPPPGELAGAPGRPRDSTRTSERAKNTWQRTSGSLPAISGECVKGGILPFHKTERGESRAQTLERERLGSGLPEVRVSRSRAMPVGDRRSRGRRWWCGFRAAARCRSETGAPCVVGAGFALTRDGGRRPPPGELAGAPGRPRDSTRTSERAKNTWQRTSGSLPAISGECVKGGILPFHKTERGESRAQTLERERLGSGLPEVRVSRSRAMPVGDRRSRGRRWWCRFRAAARCRSETGAPCVVGAGFALTRDGGRRPPPGELAGAPGRPRDSTRTSERAKNTWQRTSGSLPAISGECVKGGILPFHN